VVVQDKVVAEKLRISLTNKSIVLSPDVADLSSPATDCQLVKQIKEKARNRKIVGLLGSQGKRKGLLTMLKISQHLKEENFFLFLLENQVGNLSRLRK
jgi:cephalosporin hydroxylase